MDRALKLSVPLETKMKTKPRRRRIRRTFASRVQPQETMS